MQVIGMKCARGHLFNTQLPTSNAIFQYTLFSLNRKAESSYIRLGGCSDLYRSGGAGLFAWIDSERLYRRAGERRGYPRGRQRQYRRNECLSSAGPGGRPRCASGGWIKGLARGGRLAAIGFLDFWDFRSNDGARILSNRGRDMRCAWA
jgi:hypothetical protein